MKYERRIVAFIDILGFSSMIQKSEQNPLILDQILKALNFFKNYENPEGWDLETIEIEEDAQVKGVDSFKIDDKTNITCFSDSIVISVNLKDIGINEAFSSLVAKLSYMGAFLLTEGILIRGGLTVGNLIHTNEGIILGQALIESYKIESNISIYPRIVLSNKIINELKYPINFKHERYPYHQYIHRFEDGCVGFHQIIFYSVVQSWVEMDKMRMKDDLNKIRKIIIKGMDESIESPDIYKKYIWLKDAYNNIIILDKNTKEPIRELNEGIGGGNIHYSYTDNFYSNRPKNIST